VAQNGITFFSYALTSSNINRFSKFCHCENQKKICNNAIAKDPISAQINFSFAVKLGVPYMGS